MIRASILAAATLAFAAPVFAENAAAPAADAATAAQAQLSNQAGEREARTHLLGQGYTNISELQLDNSGRWAGTAMKDGKVVVVAIHVPVAKTAPATN